MKGLMFRPEIWQAKQKVLESNGIAVTRRLGGLKEINQEPEGWRCELYQGDWQFDKGVQFVVVKPRYRVGDIVYIKEAWAGLASDDNTPICDMSHHPGILFYKAAEPDARERIRGKWRSPLFMPEWAARYFIKITAVRYERLNSITPEDCLAEGIFVPYQSAYESLSTDYRSQLELLKGFRILWDRVNPSHPWEANPWDVVYSFVFQAVGDLVPLDIGEGDYGNEQQW